MSVYTVGTEITVTWILPAEASPPAESSYDIVFVPSTLSGTYTDAGLLSYVAPTAAFPGSVTFAFLPVSVGLFKVLLTTGTGGTHTVIDESTFWAFSGVLTSDPSTYVRGVLSYAAPTLLYTTTASVLTWREINGVCGDPNDPDLLWIAGWHTSADTLASIASIRISTGDITEYQDVITNVINTDSHGIAVGPTGRVVVLKVTPEAGNNYEAYYSDGAPYTTWTKCTRDAGYSQAFGGAYEILYDEYLEVWLWMSSTKVGISLDGITWYLQEADIAQDDIAPWNNMSSSGWMFRIRDRLSNILTFGSSTISGDSERFTYTTINGPVTSIPITPTLIDLNVDVYGATVPGSKIVTAAPHPGGEELLLINRDGFIITTNGAGDADLGSIVDVEAQVSFTGTVRHFFWMKDFDKYMLITSVPATWYESVDGENWTLSTDTRFTAYTALPFNGFDACNALYRYPDHRGVAFTVNPTGFASSLIVTQ
jgi:hypothetical protein